VRVWDNVPLASRVFLSREYKNHPGTGAFGLLRLAWAAMPTAGVLVGPTAASDVYQDLDLESPYYCSSAEPPPSCSCRESVDQRTVGTVASFELCRFPSSVAEFDEGEALPQC